MKNELLIIYNTCGLSGKDNTDYYIEALRSIRSQSFQNYKLIVSSCKNKIEHLDKIKESVPVDLIVLIDDILPVNITFNKAVELGIEYFGQFESFLYLDSGIKFTETSQLETLNSLHNSGNYGMTSAQVDNDMGWCWFGLNEYSKPRLLKDLIVPVGKAVNLHCQIFHKDLLDFYGRIIPDVFKSYCTESVFSFLNAALKKSWIISSKVYVHHQFTVPDGQPDNGDGLDGHSYGFRDPPGTWDSIYPPQTMREICNKEEGTKYGFGYEELRGIKMHNPNCFDSEGFCLNENLKTFLKENLFRKEEFDYSKINKTIICSP